MNRHIYTVLLLIGVGCAQLGLYASENKTVEQAKPVSQDTKEALLKVGDTAPLFEGTAFDGSKVRLADYKGKKIVLYFYPKSNTFGCNAQAFSFRDNAGAYQRNNIVVIGVSYDTPDFQKEYKSMYALPFMLIGDTDKKISKLYGTFQPHNEWVPERRTFLIDESGKITAILTENAAKSEDRIVVTTHAQDVLKRFGITDLRPY